MEWYGINSHMCLCLILLLFLSITIIIDLSFWLFCSQLTLFIAKWHSIIWIYNDWLMLMDIWAISSLGPLWVKLLWTCLLVPSVCIPLHSEQERRAPSPCACTPAAARENTTRFPDEALPIGTASARCERSCCFVLHRHLTLSCISIVLLYFLINL